MSGEMSDADELSEIEKLIAGGFDVGKSTDEEQSTLLHYASRYGEPNWHTF